MRRLLLIVIAAVLLPALSSCRPTSRPEDPPANLTADTASPEPKIPIPPEALDPHRDTRPVPVDPDQATPAKPNEPEQAEPSEPREPEQAAPSEPNEPAAPEQAESEQAAPEQAAPAEPIEPSEFPLPEALDPDRDGVPEPAEPEEPDDVEIPQAPKPTGIRSVDRYMALPDLAAVALSGSDGNQAQVPVDVTTLEEPVEPCSVTLHGLEDANRFMPKEVFHLAAKSGNDSSAKLRISLKNTISAVPEGKFFITDNQLRFRWLREFSEQERDSLRWLSACIVEVSQRDSSQRIALYKQVHLDSLPLKPAESGFARTATIDLTGSPEKNGLHPVGEFDFLLGHGRLHLDDGQTIAFGKDRPGRRTQDVPELVEQFDLKSATVKLERRPPSRFARQLTVELIPKWFNTKEMLDAKLERERALNRLLNGYQFDAQRGNADKALEQLQELAELMEITPTPEPRYADTEGMPSEAARQVEAANAKKRTIYLNRLIAEVFNPALRQSEKLAKEIKKLRYAAGSDEMEYLEGLEKKTARIEAISVVLGRLVDGEIRTEDVIIGEP